MLCLWKNLKNLLLTLDHLGLHVTQWRNSPHHAFTSDMFVCERERVCLGELLLGILMQGPLVLLHEESLP